MNVCVWVWGGGGWGDCRPTHLPMQQLPPAALRLRWITEGREQEMMRRGRETRVHQPIKPGRSSVQTGGLQGGSDPSVFPVSHPGTWWVGAVEGGGRGGERG